MEKSSSRRRFLKSVTAMSAAALPASALAAEPKESHAQHAAPKRVAAAPSSQSRPYMFLTQSEAAFLDAAVARLIPRDELGPGAKEAGVAYFIDQQLFGDYGTMAKKYKASHRLVMQNGARLILHDNVRTINRLTPRLSTVGNRLSRA